jgi:hypothetical protein
MIHDDQPIPPDTERGLYRKYELFRVSNDPGHYFQILTPFFVLRYDSDPHARAALVAYAESCRADYPQLADDLIGEATKHGGLDCQAREESPYPTQEQMDADDARELYRLAHWLHQNHDDTRLTVEPIVDWAIRNIATAERKLATIRTIAANNAIGGMSVPMGDRIIAIIDNTEKGI